MGGVIYLLDSNVLSEPTKPRPHPQVLGLMKEHARSLAMSVLTWHELLYGCHRLPQGKRKQRLLGYFRRTVTPYVSILEFNEEMARWLVLERARLSAKGSQVRLNG